MRGVAVTSVLSTRTDFYRIFRYIFLFNVIRETQIHEPVVGFRADGQLHYYDEPDPARALALLEEEMSAAVPPPDDRAPDGDSAGRTADGLDALARLLAAECEAQVQPGPALGS